MSVGSHRAVGRVAIAAVLLIGAGGAAGYLLGSKDATGASQANQARRDAYNSAYDTALRVSRSKAQGRGERAGLAKGRMRAVTAGGQAGSADARVEAQKRRAAEAAEAQAAAEVEGQAAAEAAAAQEVFCPLAVDNSATQAECDAMSAQEARCGGLDPSRVQRDGSYLPKPGC